MQGINVLLTEVSALEGFPCIDEYSMMSHCQGNAKLEYNGVQGAIAGDHFYYKRERNTVLQLE